MNETEASFRWSLACCLLRGESAVTERKPLYNTAHKPEQTNRNKKGRERDVVLISAARVNLLISEGGTKRSSNKTERKKRKPTGENEKGGGA